MSPGPDQAALAEARNVLGRLRYEDVILGGQENALFTLLPEYDRRGELIDNLLRECGRRQAHVMSLGMHRVDASMSCELIQMYLNPEASDE